MRRNFSELFMRVEPTINGVFIGLSRSVTEIVMSPDEADLYADKMKEAAAKVRSKATNSGIDTGAPDPQ